MTEVTSRKKDAHEAMCNSTGECKNRYKSAKNKAAKTVSNAMREKAEEELTGFKKFKNEIFTLVKGIKIDNKEVEEGRCMR